MLHVRMLHVHKKTNAPQVLDNILERLPEQFAMDDLRGRLDEPTPYAMVAIQECERMNTLLAEMRRSLLELDLGLRGDLTMSESMDKLVQALADDAVPGCWSVLAYPSLRPLGLWFADLLQVCFGSCATGDVWRLYYGMRHMLRFPVCTACGTAGGVDV